MKAAVIKEYGGPEALVYQDVPTPRPGRNEVLVRVGACSCNHLDTLLRSGFASWMLKLPHIAGLDVAGEVADVGADVEEFKPGERVLISPTLRCLKCEYCLAGYEEVCYSYGVVGWHIPGGYAEYIKVPAANVLPLPANLSYEEAAALPTAFQTSWHMLITRAQLKPGEDVLIIGAGSGIGSAAVQIAKLCGARVFATAGSDDKLEKAKELGADFLINHNTTDFSEEVKRLTGGRGVDVVFEHVGPATWEKSLKSLAKLGRLVTCGITTGQTAPVDILRLFLSEHTILGSVSGNIGELRKIIDLASRGHFKAVIYKSLPLKDAAEAHRIMDSREHFGKLVLIP